MAQNLKGYSFCDSNIIDYLCKRNMNMEIKKDLTTPSKGILQNNDSEYVRLFYVRLPKIQTASGQLTGGHM